MQIQDVGKTPLPRAIATNNFTEAHGRIGFAGGFKTENAKANFLRQRAKLIEHGLAPSTPGLFAESLGRSDERLVRTTIAELAEQLARGGAASTAAVIMFGALAEGGSS